MKFIILLLLPCVAISQPPKKCNEIRVSPTTFKESVNLLLDAGYSIEKIDSNFLTVRTEPKNYSNKVGGMVQINLRIKDSVAIITGFCGLRKSDFDAKEGSFMSGKYYYPIENRGMKGSLLKEAFEAIDSFAQSFNKPVEYRTN